MQTKRLDGVICMRHLNRCSVQDTTEKRVDSLTSNNNAKYCNAQPYGACKVVQMHALQACSSSELGCTSAWLYWVFQVV